MNKITLLSLLLTFSYTSYTQSIKMVNIKGGSFYMGGSGDGENFDEAPIHKVNISDFRISETEITNEQYEQFSPQHRTLRGKNNLSFLDNEAVIYVSYQDALSFCEWLSKRDSKNYRLPTEAEWEYACRADSYYPFSFGESLPSSIYKNQIVARDFKHVSLIVGESPANKFGLYDMHGNVEEWCLDWYGKYSDTEKTNPAGYSTGTYRVTRGGSHHTPDKYLRSSNRMAMIPSDKHSQLGFRIVESSTPLNYQKEIKTTLKITQKRHKWIESDKAIFTEPIPFVLKPDCHTSEVPLFKHNHQPAITWCDNGDILVIWFSANEENGRDMVVLSSRLKPNAKEWEKPTLFFKVPDRNMTGSSLFNDNAGTLYHFNGVEASGDWQNLAMIKRTSTNNGAIWSAPQIIAPEHTKRHQVIAGTIKTKNGDIIQLCDAGPGSHDGTAIHISTDNGDTFNDPWNGAPLPDFKDGETGTTIAGIHAGIVELNDGKLLALGRGNSIKDKNNKDCMPMNISSDMGRTWSYHASEFPPIDGGQRLTLLRLNEGIILLISFTDHPLRTPENKRGIEIDGIRRYGLYGALSYDEGKTWKTKKLISDGKYRFLNGGAWTQFFEMDATRSEPRGYMAITQSPDNMIHLVSSRLYYRFNLKWLELK